MVLCAVDLLLVYFGFRERLTIKINHVKRPLLNQPSIRYAMILLHISHKPMLDKEHDLIISGMESCHPEPWTLLPACGIDPDTLTIIDPVAWGNTWTELEIRGEKGGRKNKGAWKAWQKEKIKYRHEHMTPKDIPPPPEGSTVKDLIKHNWDKWH